MTVLMSPDMANFSGNVHGGAILKLLDQVAYSCASRFSTCYVVTLSVDQVMFLQPIHVGELVTFLASVNYTGTSSMEVGVKVVAEDIRSQVVRHVNSCFFTMVAVTKTASRWPCPGCTPLPPTKSAAGMPPCCARHCARNWPSVLSRCAQRPWRRGSRQCLPDVRGGAARGRACLACQGVALPALRR